MQRSTFFKAMNFLQTYPSQFLPFSLICLRHIGHNIISLNDLQCIQRNMVSNILY